MRAVPSTPVYWLSPVPAHCQMPGCSTAFDQYMYDCSIPTFGGQWGNICHTCFKAHGCRTGLGYGQKYELQPDGKWLKIEG